MGGYSNKKCLSSEKYVHFCSFNTWLGSFVHEKLPECGVAWRRPACGSAEV